MTNSYKIYVTDRQIDEWRAILQKSSFKLKQKDDISIEIPKYWLPNKDSFVLFVVKFDNTVKYIKAEYNNKIVTYPYTFEESLSLFDKRWKTALIRVFNKTHILEVK